MKPQALFLDIDGTILRSDHSLSPRVAKAIAGARDAGVLVVLATGRSWEALLPLYRQLDLNGPTICYNGAMVVKNPQGSVEFQALMDEAVADAVVEEVLTHNREMVAYKDGRLLYGRPGAELDAYLRRVSIPRESTDLQALSPKSFTKTIIFGEPGSLDGVKADFEARFGTERLSATYSDPRFLEMMAGGVDKGRGVKEVCRLHGIDPLETMAMGDGWNDLAMLEASAFPVVMGGAPDDLKARFSQDHWAPGADQDGAAVVIETFLAGRTAE